MEQRNHTQPFDEQFAEPQHRNPKKNPETAPSSNVIKDPEDWVTGEERMTGAQASYLKTLCEEAGEEFTDQLTKAEASRRIEELQDETGRGLANRRPV